MGGSTTNKSAIKGILKSMRPKQWVKNVLVGAVPVLDGSLARFEDWGRVFLGFAAFCLIASGAYILNDVVDIERDKVHPKKKLRPIAAGIVPKLMAQVSGVSLVIFGLLVSLTQTKGFIMVCVVYAAYTFLYSNYLKHVPTVELVALSSGFVLRTAGGAVLVEAAVSSWFFVCVAGGALLMASGKKSAELMHSPTSRPVLQHYNESYLTTIRSAAVAAGFLGYALWVFDGKLGGSVLAQASIIPYISALFQYANISARGLGGEPEDVVLEDRVLQASGILWVVLAGAALLV